ncbi:hypothetical protein SAMN05421839_10939 [Halolactibacillus halophilus]|uniref:Uncharacterized protein n=1 Tax=Halolactibacillus halophilus TaxID=306540 RepID=A0A1I5NGM1_9BACI|nr:hypothetical protein [Halolactibacillus halophilus]GEM01326.1 hypothetical protein HHA03_08580 [Halolactibacillus halophilus]SFP20943.1 hypothetical protein SAMN05421839_10939 [Halolactibacillus halophilus]
MAFGITREELKQWQQQVTRGDIAFLTHYWQDSRFKEATSVTKVGSSDLVKLKQWGEKYNLHPNWIDYKEDYPHFDLFPPFQKAILEQEGYMDHIKRFNL